MKSALLVVLLAAAASAAVVSNEVPDVDVNEIPEVFFTDEDVLLDVAELTDEVEKPVQTAARAVDTRHNLNQGSISSKDLRILKSKYKAKGIAGQLHLKTMTVSTNRRISAVRVNRVGASQGATPSVIGGGIGCSFITIRILSAVGGGYYYKIQVYVS